MMRRIISRLAPSPSGYLHLGNAWSFVICWLICRSMNGELILRIDDLDPERSRSNFINSIIEDLHWLGLDWDKGPEQECGNFYFQSRRSHFYNTALEQLQSMGKLYPCFCSRRELRMLANAPHLGECEKGQPCPCSSLSIEQVKEKLSEGRKFALKFKTDSLMLSFHDLIYGRKEYSCTDYGGDFALKRSDGVFSYQLASAVDDALMGVNLVVRGNDLLESCPRQILILKNLGYEIPQFAHLPLILDHKGERLAKRHSGLSIRALREQGKTAEDILGLIAYWAKIHSLPEPASISDILQNFSLNKIPSSNIQISDYPFIL